MKEKRTGVEDEPSDFKFDKEFRLYYTPEEEKIKKQKHESGKAGVDN